MGAIVANTKEGKKREVKAEFIAAKADAAITEINSDLALLGGSPTNAQVLQVLSRALQRQRKIIKYLASLND